MAAEPYPGAATRGFDPGSSIIALALVRRDMALQETLYRGRPGQWGQVTLPVWDLHPGLGLRESSGRGPDHSFARIHRGRAVIATTGHRGRTDCLSAAHRLRFIVV